MNVEPVLASLKSRQALNKRFGDNALLLYALEMRFGLDDIMTEGSSCLTDGPGDKKCDLLYIDRDTATAVIAQGYCSQASKQQAPANKASDLNTAVAWVLGGGSELMSESLAAAADELHLALREGWVATLELWYCHNLPESSAVKSELERGVETAKGLLSIRYPTADVAVRPLEVGLGRLSEWYESLQSPILVSGDIEVKVDGWFEEVGENWTAICASVPAQWLTSLYEQHGERLFSANVRGYMPSRQTARNINHNMERTARECPGHFWAFNNGVTVLVHDYQAPNHHHPGERLRLSGLAIINGAQTTGALSRSRGPQLDDASVLARFIRCDDDSIVDDLIRYNNSQNPIKPSDFRSMDRHQERLRQQFEAIPDATYLGARRGGEQDRARRPSNLIPSDTAAQCLAAFHGDPGTAYHDLRSIWERDEIYSKYFSDFTTAPHIVLTYSLLGAIQNAKAGLVSRENAAGGGGAGLASDEAEMLSFFRQRGSQFLLMSALANCVEIFLDMPIPDRFALSFGPGASSSLGRDHWQSIVEAMLPFTYFLRANELKGNLRSRSRVDEVIATFRANVRSAARSNHEIFSAFRQFVAIGTSSR